MFRKSAEKYAQNIALFSDNDQIIRYSDILNFSDRLKKNIEVRSLVFCLCENTIGSLIGYFSFMSNGTVPLMLDASIDQVMLNSLIKIYEPNYLWINNSLLNSYANFEVKYTEFNYSLVLLSDNKVALNEQLALLLTTSGSTGSPKLVRLSYENIQPILI